MNNMQGYRGTRDFLPKEWKIQKWLFANLREISNQYGFEEYEAPIIEKLELFTKKSGDEIKKQLFNFKDKSGRELCLRAELTPQLARYIVQYGKGLKKPLKWYSIPRLFRYERPQKGRYREFFQYNADIIDSNLKGTAEIINLCIDILNNLGLKSKDFVMKINDREVVDKLIKKYKVKTEEFYSLLDKKYKMSEKEFFKELDKISKSKELKKILKLKDKECLAEIKKNGINTERMEELFKLCDEEFIEFDLSIVRGLAYYTGIVFEAYDKKGYFRSLLGGGEYDNLISDFGGPKIPCVGVGISDGTLPLLLKKKKLLPTEFKNYLFIATIGEVYEKAGEIAKELRAKRLNVYLNTSDLNISKQLELADSLNYQKVLIIGERDLKKGEVTLKDLETGKEKKVKPQELTEIL
ncbi:histidine--tRNA ligase [archaeon]|nr:histidine--tRNA ligase [archaeon]